MKRIKVTIDALGNPKVEAEGFHGGECAQATKGIEEALGGVNGADRTLKPEYYTEGDESEENHNQIGW